MEPIGARPRVNLKGRDQKLRAKFPKEYRDRAESAMKQLNALLGLRPESKPVISPSTHKRTLPQLVEETQRLERLIRESEKKLIEPGIAID